MHTWDAMRKKQRYCGQLQNHVWIANFRGEIGEIAIPFNSLQHHNLVHKLVPMPRHNMDQDLWQTIESIDSVFSSYLWMQTTLSCGKYCWAMQIGTVSRFRLRRRSAGIKIQEEHCAFLEITRNKTNCRFAQFDKIWNHSLDVGLRLYGQNRTICSCGFPRNPESQRKINVMENMDAVQTDFLTKGNFTHDEWNHLLCLLVLAISVPQLLWNNDEAISTRFRRRGKQSKMKTHDKLNCQAVVRVVFRISEPGEETSRKLRSGEINCRRR